MRVWLLLSLLSVAACETGAAGDALAGTDVVTHDAEGSEPDATPGDAEGGDDVAPLGVSGPSPALESPLTELGVDALLPDLSGDDLVWYEAHPIPVEGAREDAAEAPEPGAPAAPVAPVDCLACPGCGGCTWQLHHRNLATGAERVIAEETYVQAAPRVGDGRVVWLRADGQLGISELATGAERSVANNNGWYGATPIPFDGKLWWYGYNYVSGQSGLMRAAADGTGGTLVAVSYMNESWTVPNGSFANVGRWQPFAISEGGAVWSEWGNGSQRVRRWPLSGAPETLLEDPSRDYTSATILPTGEVVTKSYDRTQGCSETNCKPEIRLYEGGHERKLSAGRPSIYGRPVVGAGRLFWFDYRDGPYRLWSRLIDDPDAEPERVTSDDAVLSAAVPPAVSNGRVVWMDRRDGNWRLYTKAL